MKAIDPRSLSDIDLLLYIAMGDLPKKGWPGRNRVIVGRLIELAVVAALVVVVGWVALVYVTAFAA